MCLTAEDTKAFLAERGVHGGHDSMPVAGDVDAGPGPGHGSRKTLSP